MIEIFRLTKYVLFQTVGFTILIAGAIAAAIMFVFFLYRWFSIPKKVLIPIVSVFFLGVFLVVFSSQGIPQSFKFPLFLKTFGPSTGPELPFKNISVFFRQLKNMEHVADIAKLPDDIPPPIKRNYPETVKVEMTAKEVVGEMADGVTFNYWTFDGRVPGPMIRVREGDTVELTLKNDPSSVHHHSIDLHAVNGPGGGHGATKVAPGESKTFKFKALNPGLYVYHCAHPNVATHMAHGMYGMILVEPEAGLPEVDKEFYVMQGEFYSAGGLGKKGLQIFDAKKMINGQPEYIVFNGKTNSLNPDNMKVNVGDTVSFFVGNGGVNLISSFHLIGEIFDKVYPEASIGGDYHYNVQTTLIPAGGAAITEFKMDVPGNYILVDHALARLDRGAWGVMIAEGEENLEIFDPMMDPLADDGHSHTH
ncbi:MAG: Copper-containing nitrite reductase [Parcubacteria group bacterium GW2011_GWE2_40_8]|nr:MAG: Copper-containing nitrite reductase [Parcubacteria group bacterium GW2011_GWE2_40_8]